MLGAKFEALLQTLTNHATTDRDHESRIRLLESRLTVLESSSTTSRGTWREVAYLSLAMLTLIATAISDLIIAFHH